MIGHHKKGTEDREVADRSRHIPVPTASHPSSWCNFTSSLVVPAVPHLFSEMPVQREAVQVSECVIRDLNVPAMVAAAAAAALTWIRLRATKRDRRRSSRNPVDLRR